MSVGLFITNLDFLTKLQAVFNLDDFILNFNPIQINVQGGFFFKINKRAGRKFSGKSIILQVILIFETEKVIVKFILTFLLSYLSQI